MAFLCFLSFGVPEFCFVNQFLMGSFLDLFFLCYGCIMPRKLECSSAKEFHVLAYYSVLKFLDALTSFGMYSRFPIIDLSSYDLPVIFTPTLLVTIT